MPKVRSAWVLAVSSNPELYWTGAGKVGPSWSINPLSEDLAKAAKFDTDVEVRRAFLARTNDTIPWNARIAQREWVEDAPEAPPSNPEEPKSLDPPADQIEFAQRRLTEALRTLSDVGTVLGEVTALSTDQWLDTSIALLRLSRIVNDVDAMVSEVAKKLVTARKRMGEGKL